MGADGEQTAVPPSSDLTADNTTTLKLGGGDFLVQIPRDLNKCYGKRFTVSFQWAPADTKTKKKVIVHFDDKQQFLCEQSLLL